MTIEDPVARLSAGLAEDERIARAATERAAEWKEMDAAVVGGPFTPAEPEYLIEESGEHTIVYREGYPLKPEAQHIARHDPASTLRRVEAIRKVLRRHEEAERDSVLSDRDAGFEAGLYAALEELACAYPEDTNETEGQPT